MPYIVALTLHVSLLFTLDAEPLSQLNPKKKIFETVQPGKVTVSFSYLFDLADIKFRIHNAGNERGCVD